MNRATRKQLRRKAKKKQWDPRFLNGHGPVDSSLHWVIMEAFLYGLVVTSTTGGVHSKFSLHYSGRAVDFGVEAGLVGTLTAKLRLLRFQRHMHSKHGRRLAELFGPSNRANRKWGKALQLAEGSALEQLHDNHVHVAI